MKDPTIFFDRVSLLAVIETLYAVASSIEPFRSQRRFNFTGLVYQRETRDGFLVDVPSKNVYIYIYVGFAIRLRFYVQLLGGQ